MAGHISGRAHLARVRTLRDAQQHANQWPGNNIGCTGGSGYGHGAPPAGYQSRKAWGTLPPKTAGAGPMGTATAPEPPPAFVGGMARDRKTLRAGARPIH